MELRYRPEIDGLRSIAVLSVIIYHAEFLFNFNHVLKGGFLGVDVFFVISGFLITSLIMGELHVTGRFSVLNFYERRIRRILPALLTIMMVSLPFAWKYLTPTQLIDFSKSLIASLLFGSNFYWYDTLREYGTESALLKPFLHTWSLAIEEQYYIIFPLILIGVYRWYKKYTIFILAGILFLSLVLSEWVTLGHPSFSFYMLPSRFWELIAGGLFAGINYFYPRKENNALLSRTMPLFGLFLIFYSVVFTKLDSTHPGLITLTPVTGTLLIIWFANRKDYVTNILSSKLLVRTGLISYSLYLWHYPIFAFGRIKDLNPSVYDKFEWFILTLILSVTTYFLIERPFRDRKLISLKTMSVLLLTAIAIVGTYSFYVIQNNGVKERFPTLIQIYGKNEFDNQILKKASWTILKDLAKAKGMNQFDANKISVFESKQLWFSDNTSSKKVLIIGDSHSKDLFNAFYQNKEKFSNLEFARFGMANGLRHRQVNVLLESPNFTMSDIVIITFRYKDRTVKGIPNLIDMIKKRSKKVMLVLSITEFDEIEGKTVFDKYMETNNQDFSVLGLKKLFFNSRNHKRDKVNESLCRIAKTKGVTLLDKTDFICDMEAVTCDCITSEGYKSFYDYGHFTLEGAKYFGRRMYEINWLQLN